MIGKLHEHLGWLLSEDAGNTATEYAIVLGLITLASLVAIMALSGKIADTYQTMAAANLP